MKIDISDEIWEDKIDVMKMFFSLLNHGISCEIALEIMEENGFDSAEILGELLCNEDISNKPEFAKVQMPVGLTLIDYLGDIKPANLPIVFESINKVLEDIDKVRNIDKNLMDPDLFIRKLLQDYCNFNCTGLFTTKGMINQWTGSSVADYSIHIDDIRDASVAALDLIYIDVNSKYLTQKAIKNLLITHARNEGCTEQYQYNSGNDDWVYYNPKLPSRVAEAIVEYYEDTNDKDLKDEYENIKEFGVDRWTGTYFGR